MEPDDGVGEETPEPDSPVEVAEEVPGDRDDAFPGPPPGTQAGG